MSGLRRSWVSGSIALIVMMFVLLPVAQPRAAAAGGTLVIGSQFDVPTFDPHRATSITVAGLSTLLYDTLLYIEFDLRTVGPGLASRWEVSTDGKTYRFHLRDDVQFHSGRKLTSADVKYSFERILDKKTASPHRLRLGDVSAIETPDASTVVIKLDAPYADLLVQLTSPFMAIVDREAVATYGAKFGSTGTGGTGPFMFAEWVLNDHATLKRFAAYRWGPGFLRNRGPAHIEEIVFRIIPEYQTLLFELERGNVHTFRGLKAGDVERLRGSKAVRVLEATPTQQIHYLGFKVTRPGVSDLRVRRAVASALNREELVKGVAHGLAPVARGIFLPTVPYYWPGQESVFPRHDLSRARQLLDAAGWKPGSDGVRSKDGQPLRLTLLGMLGTVEEHEALAPMLQAQLKPVGIDLDVKLMAAGAFFAALRKPDYDLWTLSTPYVSIHELLSYWFSSKNIPSPNRTWWKDVRTDELLAEARSARDEQVRARALQQLQKIAADNQLLVPLWHETLRIPTRAEVKGFQAHGIYAAGYYKLLDMQLDR